jgi:hypothetical protein
LVLVFSNFDNSSKESIITHQSKVAATGDAIIIIFADGVNAADIIRIFVATLCLITVTLLILES